jgi:hypothetical protein
MIFNPQIDQMTPKNIKECKFMKINTSPLVHNMFFFFTS